MADVDPSVFTYRVRLTMTSLLWAAWLCLPSVLRLKAYKALEHYGHDTGSTAVVELPFGLYAKRRYGTTVTEALVTQHISLNTTIPVPAILDVLRDNRGEIYFVMTRVPGKEVAAKARSLNDYTDEELTTFVATVGGWLAQLRGLGPPPYGASVCGYMGGSLMSYRIKHDAAVGPFASQDEFHAQYYNTLPEHANTDICHLCARIRQKRYRLCLTHGDISPNNILVDDDYKPVALIDWGCAAWMPEYWELTSALYRRQRYHGWVKTITRALPQYEDELTVEMEQWKFISPW
ncbi:kinase-like domain-containing protein [Schizophyllum amplum]|uniref:Kinase-like domain-containing protein n=1 Tax=Schizophyllum amplum TaxID=97359 RepID=A0A550CK12_9AGAR|nr:kinase-like domain-containing protein [Auriculariopsis ampla]